MTDPTLLSSAEKRALLEKLLAQQVAAPADIPLSIHQQPLWLLEQIEPGVSTYNNALAVRFVGALDLEALTESARAVVRRHDALRAGFAATDGGPRQRIASRVDVELPVVDLRGVEAGARVEEVRRLGLLEIKRPFDFSSPPLARFMIFQLDDHDHVLVITAHQIVCDGWSTNVLLTDLTATYSDLVEGRPLSLAPLPLRYADVVAGQGTPAALATVETDLAWWGTALDGVPPTSEWPTDLPRPARLTGRGQTVRAKIDPELAARLRQVSRTQNVTPFTTLIAGLYALLHRHSGQRDLVVGIPSAGRDDPRTAAIVGCFVNSLALRTAVSAGMTFEALVAAVRQTTLGAFAHQAPSFSTVCDRAQVARDSARTPLFQVFFNMLNLPAPSLKVPDAVVQHIPILGSDAKFDLEFYISTFDTTWSIDLVYNRDLYRASTIEQMLERYLRALDAASTQPSIRIGDLPLDPGAPLTCVSPIPAPTSFVPTSASANDTSLVARIDGVIDRRGDAVAVVARSGSWTWAGLGARAGGVARQILARLPGDAPAADRPRVALLCDNDAPMLAAILATLAAGATYVPLDPLSPIERLRFVLDDVGADLIVTDNANAVLAGMLVDRSRLIVVEACEPSTQRSSLAALAAAAGPDPLAYVLYTSGSTGQPKGVMQSHRHVLHHSGVYVDNLRITADDRLSLMSAYGFDAAVMDIFAALLTGATLVIADVRHQGLDNLPVWIGAERITVFHATPTVYRQAVPLDAPRSAFASLRAVVLGGEEALPGDLERFRALCRADAWMVNGLGPTESTVTLQAFYSAGAASGGRSVAVGLPVSGVQVELVDADGVPSDLCGELVIRSPYVALGYWKRPELTAAAFSGAPGSAARAFRTGDLLRRLPSGEYEYLGRRDHQIKIRGFRVELGEIEATLGLHPAVRQAAVAPRQVNGTTVLAGFVEAAPGEHPDPVELRRWLRMRLPEYMLPAMIHLLPALPLTANGKLQREVLAAMELRAAETDTAALPQSDLERRLARLWQEVLGTATVSRTDDFFALGGHSLRALQLAGRIAREFGVDVPVRALFDASTLESQAALVADDREEIEI